MPVERTASRCSCSRGSSPDDAPAGRRGRRTTADTYSALLERVRTGTTDEADAGIVDAIMIDMAMLGYRDGRHGQTPDGAMDAARQRLDRYRFAKEVCDDDDGDDDDNRCRGD